MSTPLISLGTRTYLRSIASRNFGTSVTIQRHTTIDDAFGMSESWQVVSTTTCWVRQMNNPDIKPDVGGLYALGIFRVLMPWNTDVQPGDQLSIGTDLYLVQNTNAEDTNRVSMVVMAQKLEGS